MKTRVSIFKYLMLVAVVLFWSCSAEDGQDGAIGAQGPQGEQGPQGAQGEQGEPGQDGTDGADGAQGEQGEQGDPGTANVIYSDWIVRDFLFAGSSEENIQGLGVFSASELDLVTDVVLVYGRRFLGGGNILVHQLPYIFTAQEEYYGFALLTVTGGIGIQVRVNTLDGTSNIFDFFDAFRYVIIPGGQESSAKSAVDYSKMTYEEIVSHFGISD